jgi:hypothetical protein
MFRKLFGGAEKPVRSQVAFTVRNVLALRDKEIPQTQYITEHYVLNEINGQLLLYRADSDDRYLVDRGSKQLRRLDLGPQMAQVRQLQQVIGTIAAEPGGEGIEHEGHVCRRMVLQNASAQMVVSGEVLTTRVPGLERTALVKERALEQRTQAFSVDLAPDEIVVRMKVDMLAQSMEQSQTTRLVSVTPGIDGLEGFDAILAYPVAA